MATPRAVALHRLGFLLARPAAGQPPEDTARAMVEQAARGTEDRALEQQRRRQLGQSHTAPFRVGRLVIVDQPPGAVEQAFADDAGEQAAGDAEGGEQELDGDLGSSGRQRVLPR
jgi:hypothetical protein